MRNFKKIIAVAITLVMLLSVAAIGVSAETAPTISLVGASSTGLTDGTAGYYEVDVVLSDANNAVGGIEGVITYDTTKLALAKVELDTAFDDNNTLDNSINSATAGQVKFVGLATGNGTWFTLYFTTVEGATGSTSVAFTSVKGANVGGTAYIEDLGKVNNTVNIEDADVLKVEGASAKLVNNASAQDIRFRVNVDAEAFADKYAGKTVTKIGMLMMYTKRLGNRELLVNMEDKTGLANASAPTTELISYNANLNGMAANQVGIKITARAYVVLDDNTVIYSTNYSSEFETVNGCGSRSVIDVSLKAAADILAANSELDANGTIAGYIAAGTVPAGERDAFFAFVNDNKGLLKAND